MRIIGLRAIYRSPRTSRPAPGHRAFPYLLRNAKVSRPNKAWAAGITYLPMARGFVYLVAVIDWHSRYVVAWRLSNTLERTSASRHCRRRWAGGRPEIFNTDQSLPRRRTGAASSPAGSSPKCLGTMR